MLSISEFVRHIREKYGLSREDISNNTFAVSTLSDIETDKRSSSAATFGKVATKLNLPTSVYQVFIETMDWELCEIKYAFDEQYALAEYYAAEEILSKARKFANEPFSITAQLMIDAQKEMPDSKALERLELRATEIGILQHGKIEIERLEKTGLNLLVTLASAHYMAGNAGTATQILYDVVGFIEKIVYHRDDFCALYTGALYILAEFIATLGDNEEAVMLCNKGIADCNRRGRHGYLPNLMYTKGRSLMDLGRRAEAEDCIRSAYYICRALKKTQELMEIKAYTIEKEIKLSANGI